MKEAKPLEIKREDFGEDTYFVAYVLVNFGNLVSDDWQVLRVGFKNHAKMDCNHHLYFNE